jgi:hypothetical protein
MKMIPRQALDAGIGVGVDWREGDMGDTPRHIRKCRTSPLGFTSATGACA